MLKQLIDAMRLKILLLFFLFGFCSNQILTAESEAEFRANARILQERIDAENARIEKEAERIYRQKTGGSSSGNSGSVANYFMGWLCFGSFFGFIFYLVFPKVLWVLEIIGSIFELFQIGNVKSKRASRYDSFGGFSCRSDFEDYLSELRKPINLINEESVEDHSTGFVQKVKDKTVNLICSVKSNVKNKNFLRRNKKPDSNEAFPCAGCGGIIENVDLLNLDVCICPHCEEYLIFKEGGGFSRIKTSPCCHCRQLVVVDGLLLKSVVDCPHCSKKMRYTGGGNERKSSFAKTGKN
jgi:DNA-directed RNA polymerase subunit RPC12/RpoP